MQTLPPALQALAAYPHFIIYRLQPSTLRPGKTDKFPVDHRTGALANAHDPAIWMDAETAISVATLWGEPHGVGFVFTERDPFWFLDIDECLTPAGWSPVALELCQRLPGAAVEISKSGRGLHIFGTGAVPAHGCKNIALHLELYTSGRFVALTGTGAQGDAGTDLGPQMAAIVAQYFSGSGPGAAPADWTEGPCEGWSGPESDDKLIEMMLNASPSAAAAFQGKATPRNLWEANTDALARAFPDAHRAYDASSADAALAHHLAFWTGNDCARIERIMRRSALVREKWDLRENYYLRRTIVGACGKQGARVLSLQPKAAEAAPFPPIPGISVGTMIPSDLEAHFAGCVQLETPYGAFIPDGSILNPQQFRSSNRYGGREFPVTLGGKPVKDAWVAFAENCTGYRPAFANRLCFRPELPPRAIIEESGRLLLNSYVPIKVASTPGDISPFLNHLAKLLPDQLDRDYLLAYMASCVQNPGVKFQWAPLVQGVEGNGKSFLGECMIQAIGERYSHTGKADAISNNFNGWVSGKLFVCIEEINVRDKTEMVESLKPLITNRRIEIESKGVDQVMGDNRANLLLLTNHKDAVPKSRKDRRYGIFFTAQQEELDLVRDGMGGNYFPRFYDWAREEGGYAIITHDLQTYAIPVALDPAKDCHRAPITSSTSEAIEAALGPLELMILEAVTAEEKGFRGGWISSTYLAQLMHDSGLRSKALGSRRDEVMKSLGYIPHPALKNGWTNNAVNPDFKKARLWVKKDSIAALNFLTAADAARGYSQANDTASATFGAATP